MTWEKVCSGRSFYTFSTGSEELGKPYSLLLRLPRALVGGRILVDAAHTHTHTHALAHALAQVRDPGLLAVQVQQLTQSLLEPKTDSYVALHSGERDILAPCKLMDRTHNVTEKVTQVSGDTRGLKG